MLQFPFSQDQLAENSNIICKECNEKIENAFNFKSCLVNSIESYKLENDIHNIPSKSGKSAEMTICHLCNNSLNEMYAVSLTKLLKDDIMLKVFQQHIKEVVSYLKYLFNRLIILLEATDMIGY